MIGERIVAVGRVDGRGRREIDAEGHVVTPGFIDGHTHMDAQVFWDPLGTCSCWHGVTTVIMGNCGFSLAPARADARALVVRNLERAEDISAEAMAAGIDWRWETFPEYLDAVDRRPKGINYAAYVGHSALRTWAMGERAFEQAAGPEDLACMETELRAALRAGATGLTTSRSANHETSDDRPVASRLAAWSEVERLVGVLADEGRGVFELALEPAARSGDEATRRGSWTGWARLARTTGVPTTFGVLGGTDRPLLDLIDDTVARGGHMFGQSHGRGVAGILSFRTRLPFDGLDGWREVRSRSEAEQLALLADPEVARGLVAAAARGDYGRAIGAEARRPDFDRVYLMDRPLPPHRTVAEAAAERRIDPVALMIELAVASRFDQLFIQPITSERDEDILPVLRHPRAVMTFSDAGAHVSQVIDSSIQTHLLAHWVRQRHEFTLAQAVRMLTAVPAAAWGILDRGRVAEGAVADLNVFDPATVGPSMPEVADDLPGGARRLRQGATGSGPPWWPASRSSKRAGRPGPGPAACSGISPSTRRRADQEAPMARILKPGTSWDDTWARCRRAAPEAFEAERPLNLVAGEWSRVGVSGQHTTPVDGTTIPGPPFVGVAEAEHAVAGSVAEHGRWATVDLDERRRRVHDAVEDMAGQRDLLALLLVWEIGKPWRLAWADVDRCIDGVRWYLQEIERQLSINGPRRPLPGPVSNIASWNYPMSVQVHAELVQLLAGNAVIAKTPTQGGFHCLTLAHSIMRRAGLPVTLISGEGRHVGETLIRSEGIGALAFVGGRANGRKAAVSLADTGRRHMLEQEGLNTWGIWDFGQWDLLAELVKKGFEYAKQRCTAYPRFVVQRRLFDRFLEAYLPVVREVRFGHPLAVADPDDPLPDLDFGPVIHATKADDLRERFDEAVSGGGIPLYRGSRGRRPLPGRSGHRGLPGRLRGPGLGAPPAHLVVPAPRRALRTARLGRPGRHRVRAPGGHERQQRLAGGLHRHRRRGLRGPGGRAAAGVQGRGQPAPVPGRPRGGLRRPRGLVEGGVRRRRPAGPGGHRGPDRGGRAALRQLPVVLAVPGGLSAGPAPRGPRFCGDF